MMDEAFTIKMCGLGSHDVMAAALEAGADMVGLVFHPRSPRFVSDERVERTSCRQFLTDRSLVLRLRLARRQILNGFADVLALVKHRVDFINDGGGEL